MELHAEGHSHAKSELPSKDYEVRAKSIYKASTIPGSVQYLTLSFNLYSAPRGFSQGTPVFPSPQKPTFDLI